MCTQDCDQFPWLFLTSSQHDPAVYGYRTVILERHYPSFVAAAGPVHRICASDEAMFTTLTCPSQDDDDDSGGDFHRRYRPYQRLIAAPYDDSPADSDGRAAAVEEAALRFARDDVKLVRRRLGRKSSIGNLPTDSHLY